MKLIEKKTDKENYSIVILNVLLWLVVFSVSTYVVYEMTTNSPEPYTSDYPAHISSAMSGTGYSVMEIIMKLLYMISGNTVLISIFIGVLTSTTAVAVIALVNYLSGIQGNSTSVLFSYCSIFLASIFIPVLNPFWYAGQTERGTISSFITQPWHNSTYVGMRVFAIISVLIFLRCWDEADEGIKLKDLILLCIMLAITNLFKPNFIIAFGPAVFIMLFIEFIFFHRERWKEYAKIFAAGIISMLPLVLQYKMLFIGGNGGWQISTERFWAYIHQDGGIFVLLTNFLFPVIITILAAVNDENVQAKRSLVLAWIMELASLFESVFLAETGDRANDGNFSWGIYCTTLILFIICFAVLVRLKNDRNCKCKGVLTLAEVLLIMHTANGFMYFGNIFKGYSYLC